MAYRRPQHPLGAFVSTLGAEWLTETCQPPPSRKILPGWRVALASIAGLVNQGFLIIHLFLLNFPYWHASC
jgi:hypothetical protein